MAIDSSQRFFNHFPMLKATTTILTLSEAEAYFTAEEIAQQERLRVEQLEQYLRSLGIDPDNLPGNP